MIFYIARKHHTLGIQLHYFPGKLAEIVRLLPYEALYANGELPAGSYIFTDHDRPSLARRMKRCVICGIGSMRPTPRSAV